MLEQITPTTILCRTVLGAADMDLPQKNHPRLLTAEELELLKVDMHNASMLMRAELRRRAEHRRSAERNCQLLKPNGG